jgi:cation diffusion facilitator CzcD-associated flavoprotein CzcO
MAKTRRAFDVVVVGAGFAGLYMVHRVRELGLTVCALEAGSGVGGTWYWNRYPGARCDVESLQYSYQFSDDLQQEWEWSERYASQAEILRYLEHVTDRFVLRPSIQFDTRVTEAVFDESSDRWTVRTDGAEEFSSQFLIMATGCLSAANVPDIAGAATFSGLIYHTGRWPHGGVDFTDLRVGVIGTGSSAVQTIPLIAQQARDLVVFQRTAAYSVPSRNGPMDEAEQREIKANYSAFRAANSRTVGAIGDRRPRTNRAALSVSAEERRAEYEARWTDGGLSFLGAFADLMIDSTANETAANFVRSQIRAVVDDPDTAERLCPDQVIGCKRMCVDTGYYATFNRPNVRLVDLRETPIDAITPNGISTSGGHYELDLLVYATGFDAMTGALLRIDIKGRNGITMQQAWAAGPRTYLGLGVASFPNLFTVSGPGSPSVLTNMIVSIEQHVDWITNCIAHLRNNGFRRIEVTAEAQASWVEFVNQIADFTLFPTCNSWYLGANVPGKSRVFMPFIGFPSYVEKCQEVANSGYEGFALG